MVDYAEKYTINRVVYGIEDHGDRADVVARFQMWRGGCGIGHTETMDEARKLIHAYARNQLRMEIQSYSEIVDRADTAYRRLGDDPFYLGKFIAVEAS